MYRKTKQLIIAFIYLVLFVLLIFGLYWLFTKPSCFDQKKNGQEEGIDCGGICSKTCESTPVINMLRVGEPTLLKDGDTWDALVEIENPNKDYGFAKIKYTLTLYRSGQPIGESTGKAYILPGEKKNLIVIGVTAKEEPDSAKLIVEKGEATLFKADQKPKLEVLNIKFSRTSEPSTFFETTFQLVNRSPNDFSVVDIEAVVKDEQDRVIALNKGNLNRLLVGDTRDFRFFWPREFIGHPVKVEVRAHTNYLDLENL